MPAHRRLPPLHVLTLIDPAPPAAAGRRYPQVRTISGHRHSFPCTTFCPPPLTVLPARTPARTDDGTGPTRPDTAGLHCAVRRRRPRARTRPTSEAKTTPASVYPPACCPHRAPHSSVDDGLRLGRLCPSRAFEFRHRHTQKEVLGQLGSPLWLRGNQLRLARRPSAARRPQDGDPPPGPLRPRGCPVDHGLRIEGPPGRAVGERRRTGRFCSAVRRERRPGPGQRPSRPRGAPGWHPRWRPVQGREAPRGAGGAGGAGRRPLPGASRRRGHG